MTDLTPQMPAPGGRAGQLDHSGLRPGWTTGACATAAARAAYTALVTGEFPDPVTVTLPHGRRPAFALTQHTLGAGWAEAVVTKDAGDDPDVTHGARIRVRVSPGAPGTGVTFVGGEGVGHVTLPGLPLAVGEPAINPAPREMVSLNLGEVAGETGGPLDVVVRIGVDDGEEIARHTWNARIGILGGLSILGTTGVVVPYSCSAWIESIRRGVDVARAAGLAHLGGATGSTSERVLREMGLPELALVDMGDFVGALLKYLVQHPVERLTICGGFAKMTKLAAGHLDLHSHRTSVDVGQIAALALEAGGGSDLAAALAGANTALDAWQRASALGFPLGDVVARAAADQAALVLGDARVAVDVICIDRGGQVIGRSG